MESPRTKCVLDLENPDWLGVYPVPSGCGRDTAMLVKCKGCERSQAEDVGEQTLIWATSQVHLGLQPRPCHRQAVKQEQLQIINPRKDTEHTLCPD